ncbi:MAG TPA: rhodanese-like domain-containing protein [Azospirillum sp.]
MRYLARIAFALVFVFASAGARAADAPMAIPGATTVDAEGIVKLVETMPTLVILDNRQEGDFNAGHIEGAVRLIDTDITGPDVMAKHVAAKDTPVLFYCNGVKCGRAAAAAQKALGWGYSKVHYYALGMEEWKAKGLPLATK